MPANAIEISTVIAVIGCFVGLAGWLLGRDKNIISEARWRGSVDTKLDLIVGIKSDILEIKELLNNHSERIAIIENKINNIERR